MEKQNNKGKSKTTTKPKDNTQTVPKSKRNTKDSVFTHLFLFPKYQLEMYRAIHPEDKTIVESDIETIA